jgi:hypothetical protein
METSYLSNLSTGIENQEEAQVSLFCSILNITRGHLSRLR